MPDRLSSVSEKQLESKARELNAIITICMCCRKRIGIKDGKGQYGISHGLCKQCEKKMMQDLEEMRDGKVHVLQQDPE
jgi:sulfur relay (sulfurtransferase) complex TusBCD TusD component (DsrE family)